MKIIKNCSTCSKYNKCITKSSENCKTWDLSMGYFLNIMDKIPSEIKEDFLNNENISSSKLVKQLENAEMV